MWSVSSVWFLRVSFCVFVLVVIYLFFPITLHRHILCNAIIIFFSSFFNDCNVLLFLGLADCIELHLYLPDASHFNYACEALNSEGKWINIQSDPPTTG